MSHSVLLLHDNLQGECRRGPPSIENRTAASPGPKLTRSKHILESEMLLAMKKMLDWQWGNVAGAISYLGYGFDLHWSGIDKTRSCWLKCFSNDSTWQIYSWFVTRVCSYQKIHSFLSHPHTFCLASSHWTSSVRKSFSLGISSPMITWLSESVLKLPDWSGNVQTCSCCRPVWKLANCLVSCKLPEFRFSW